ncbi:MAG: putative 4-hydroxybenzoate polyprenyltransferase [Candidatus Delongbacteria bacterium]|jgi:4-hydroxybenzoate polyprenyltransferase|nr:putative 4-hydroxybenzoate polyprenyltransferase [Candidatus Delongbacteria bacterium]
MFRIQIDDILTHNKGFYYFYSMFSFKHSASKINDYASFVKFRHSIFALPFALTGYFLAIFHYNYPFEWKDVVFVIICMVLARNTAMGFNRYADANIDKINPRTASREIPSGIIKPNHALAFIIINMILFVGITWFINQLVFFLSPVALLIITGYSYTKRFTGLSHYILGLSLAIAPTAAFLVASAHFELLPVLLSGMVLFWTAGFDILYALQDESFDKKNKLFSMPVLLGRKKSLIVSAITHLLSAGFLLVFGIIYQGNWVFSLGAALFTALLIYQHCIVTPNNISRINLAFGTLNGIASIVFALFTILSML